MSIHSRFVTAALLSLAVLGGWASWVSAQVQPVPITPRVLSGDDIGFRVAGYRTDQVTGTRSVVGNVVVRVNGQWVEAKEGGIVSPGAK